MRIPVVAIIGRPNVGKSTLFNRILRKPVAITDETPGVTRDRNAVEFEWNSRKFMLVDTGGFIVSSPDLMDQAVAEQSKIAIGESDVILFTVDAKSGITDIDNYLADFLHKSKKPVLLTVNKIDKNSDEPYIYEFYNLGIGDPFPVSGKTGRGSGDLLDRIVEMLPDEDADSDEESNTAVKIALIGRPNVGKSSIMNCLNGKNVVLVTDIPGTTRDSVDTRLDFDGRSVILVDTAGLKKQTKLKESLEYYSSLRTLRSLSRCDVAVIVIDINQGLLSYDKNIISDATDQGKGIIIAANKWDLIEKETMTMKRTEDSIRNEIPDKDFVPIVFTSALTGKRVDKIIDKAIEINDNREKRISTSDLNEFISGIIIPPGSGDFTLSFITQFDTNPPSFVMFVNNPRNVRDNFIRYFEKALRKEYSFIGTPIKLVFKQKKIILILYLQQKNE